MKYHLTLKTLTPIHIGSGNTLARDIEFIVKDKMLYIISPEKILEVIGSHRLESWIKSIERGERVESFLKPIIGDSFELVSDRILPLTGTPTGFLKTYMRSSLKGAYLPGSSLKGAFRTAFLDLFLKSKPANALYSWTENDIIKSGNKIKFSSERIEKKIFGSTANESIMRFIKFSDFHGESVNTEVNQIQILNRKSERWAYKTENSFLCEVLPSGSHLNGSLAFDLAALSMAESFVNRNMKGGGLGDVFKLTSHKGIIKKNINDIFKLINEYTLELVNSEIENLDSDFADTPIPNGANDFIDQLSAIHSEVISCIKNDNNSCVIRVGGNVGWKFTTGAWVKTGTEDQISNSNLDALQKNVQANKDYSFWDFPKSRKLNAKSVPLGFVKLSV